MQYAHVDPKEAVLIHLDVKSKKSIGCHWGTFVLTGEPVMEPSELLQKELTELKLPWDSFITLFIGESIVIDKDGRSKRHGKDPRKANAMSDSDSDESFHDTLEPFDEKAQNQGSKGGKGNDERGPKTSPGL
jgi:hypothetical protein